MKKNVCKIKIGNEQSTGFFCKIPFPDENNLLPVFITNNHVINKKLLYSNSEKIAFRIKEENKIKELYLNNRMKYTNEEYDITIIEIKKNDDIKDYLELDNYIIKDILNNSNSNVEYIDETIYIIQYPEGKLSVSYGVLDKILEDKKYNFNHKCSTKVGSSGSPILNNNNKLIGIHRESNCKNFNRGTFLNDPIKEFIKLNYNKKVSKEFNVNYQSNTNSNINSLQRSNHTILELQKTQNIIKPIEKFSILQMEAIKIITEEYKKLTEDPLVSFGIAVSLFNEDNIFEWKSAILGPRDSIYQGGVFFFKIIFPKNYPNEKPEILFLTPIYHLNIKYWADNRFPLGHINLTTLNSWKPGDSIITLLPHIFVLLLKNNPICPYDDIYYTRRNEFINNRPLFEKKARYFTKKYASSDRIKQYQNSWDFSFNEKMI